MSGAEVGKALSKVLRARDGPKEAHMDVLVASFEKAFPISAQHPNKTAHKRENPPKGGFSYNGLRNLSQRSQSAARLP
ncbi:hypothetical protein GCM10011362_07920 [Marinobacter halophilus]|nr:hypothetical protein GCM10011362_07920 [Marinobacter halophilus]